MKALVTGGAGFIGSAIAQALLHAGNSVAVVDNLYSGRRQLVPEAARFYQCDITTDALDKVFAEERPEVVFHQAAQSALRLSVINPGFDAYINVVGTVKVLQTSVNAGVRRVVFASTGGALYGDTESIPTPETHPLRPTSAYGVAKVCAEAYGQLFQQLHGLEFVALRYANVYGPRQDASGEAFVIAIFTERLLREQPIIINGDGLQTRDYVYIDDVVNANLTAAVSTKTGAYNIGTGRETDVNTIYQLLIQACGKPPATSAPHGPEKPGEQRRSCLAITKAQNELGWTPQVKLEAGLAATLEYFRSPVTARP